MHSPERMSNILEVIFLSLILIHNGETADRVDIENLYNNLILGGTIPELLKNIRPSVHTKVTGSLSLLSISGLDEISGTFSVMVTLTLQWNDDRLSWDPSKYKDLKSLLVPLSKIWTPSIIMRNSATKVKTLGLENNVVTVHYDGNVQLNIGDFLETICSFDVTHFPFDRQTCDLLFIPWIYSNDSVGFKQRAKDIDLSLFSHNGMWEIMDTKAEVQYIVPSSVPQREVYAELKYSIELERRYSYFVLTIFTPVTMLLFLNSAVFILPIESGERIGYSITCLLSLAVFLTLTSEVLPKTSDPLSMLSCFLMLLVMTSAGICLLTIITVWLHYKDDKSPMPMYLKKFTYCLLCRGRKTRDANDNSKSSVCRETPVENISEDSKIKVSKKSRFSKIISVKQINVNEPNIGDDDHEDFFKSQNNEKQYADITWKMFAELFNFLSLVFTLCITGILGSLYVLIARGNLFFA